MLEREHLDLGADPLAADHTDLAADPLDVEDDPLDVEDDLFHVDDDPVGRDAAGAGRMSVDNLELEKIPRHLWPQVLAPFHRSQRGYAAHRIPDPHLQALAFEVVTELDFADGRQRHERDVAHHRARRTAAPLPLPDGSHAAAESTVQVNIRLRRDDYERLKKAASSVGLRPTTLARAFVLNGATKVLQERGAP